jgi:hypothetical protein
MGFNMKKRRLVYFTVAAFALVCAGQVFGPASVTTDQSDYPPGSTATINGSGFQPGETVELQGRRTDLPENSGSENASLLLMNDDSGSFSSSVENSNAALPPPAHAWRCRPKNIRTFARSGWRYFAFVAN